MKRVDIVYFEASSGHKSAAVALDYGLREAHPDWDIRLVDLRDILRCQTRLLDFVYTKGVGFFNWCMKREQYFFFATCIRLWIVFARLNTQCRPLKFLLRWTSHYWADTPPDAIISVTPMKHTIVYEAARCVNPAVPCITIPVDYCEMTPGYWFQPAVSQHYLVGYSGLRQEALRAGVAAHDISDLSGMIIDPRFYGTNRVDREAFLNSMGLDPSLPTGLISFGGQGTVNVLRCAKQIIARGIPVNLVCLCGKNASLLAKIEALESPYPIVAQAFTDDPPVVLHQVADFLIGKPGTMTLTECLITRTAFIFVKSRGLNLVQGANEKWILDNGTGVMAETPDATDTCVLEVLDNCEMSRNIAECQHRGIFDAIEELGAIIEPPVAVDDTTNHAAQLVAEVH